MESIGYIANRNFILIGVDTNYETVFGGHPLTMDCVKKVYKLNDHNAICVIGNPYKVSDIHKYLIKLNELGQNNNFEKILEDLKDVFNSSQTNFPTILKDLKSLLLNSSNTEGYVDTGELLASLKDNPEYFSVLQDTLSATINPIPELTQVLVFSWDTTVPKSRLAHYVSIGLNLKGSELNEMHPGLFYTRIASATIAPEEIIKLEIELVQQFTPLVQVSGWDEDYNKTNAVIEKGKEILIEGLSRVTPFKRKPNIVFYELSQRTNFVFKEPDIDLKEIVYNRAGNDE